MTDIKITYTYPQVIGLIELKNKKVNNLWEVHALADRFGFKKIETLTMATIHETIEEINNLLTIRTAMELRQIDASYHELFGEKVRLD